MNLYLRLITTLRPYRRLLAVTVLATVVYALLEGVSIGMISPLTHALISRAVVEDAALPVVEDAALPVVEDAALPPAASTGLDPAIEKLAPESLELTRGLLDRLTTFLYDRDPMTALTRVSALILGLFVLKGLMACLQQVLVAMVEQAVMRDLRDGLFAHMTRLSLAFFHRRRLGELISRVTNDVNLVRAAITGVLFIGVREALLVVVSLFWVFWVSWRLALLSLAVIPPSALLIAVLGRKLRRTSTTTQERMADLTAILNEALGGMRVVKAFAMEGFEVARFRAVSQQVYRAFVRFRKYWALSSPSTEVVGAAVAVAVVFYGGHLILIERSLTPDRFFVFLVAMLAMIRPVKRLAGINADLQQGLAASQRIFDLLDVVPRIRVRSGARRLRGLDDGIRLEQVDFAYEPGLPVLRGVELEIRAGQVVALAGSSGAGKSTLADLIPRFHDPTAGRVTLDGIDLREVELGDLRRLIGVVTQEVILFNDTVRSNIAYGDDSVPAAAVRAAARAAHADAFIEALPAGYDTVIGDRGLRLSGGQRQRLAIARAILKNPPILIFDEATSALDAESERLVQQAIARLLAGRTVLVIAHRLTTIRAAHRIVVLDGGRVVEEGRHETLLERGGAYARLYGLEEAASRPLEL